MADTPISSLAVVVGALPAGTYLEVATPDVTSSTGYSSYRATAAQVSATITGYVPTTRAISTPTSGGLTGGGTLAGDLSFNWAPVNLNAKTAMVVADAFAINDSAIDAPAKVTFPNAMKALTGLSILAAPNAANDYLIINRASDGLTYKVNPGALGLSVGNLPAGGTSTQILIKQSATDYDTAWETLSGDVTISSLGVTAIGANKVTNAMLRQGVARSVIGVTGNATANVADIQGTANQILRINGAGTALAFGSIDLAQSAAVGSTVLPVANGGTNIASYTLGDTLYASGATTLTKLAGNITSGIQYLSQTGNGAVSAAPAWATISGGDITGAALTKVDDTNVTLTLGGTPATALLRAASITAGWTGQLAASRGGTGVNNSFTITVGGNLSTVGAFAQAGAFATTITATATTNSTLPAGTHTLAGLDVAQTWSANQQFNSGNFLLKGATSGTITLNAAGTAGSNTLTLPAGTTDFSATGGTSQVVKQTSAGGAFTVAQLAASDLSNGTTGSGAAVLANTPTLITPVLGVATATSINKIALTAPASSATLTISDGKTLTASNSITIAGTDTTTMTFPPASASIGYLNVPQNSQSAAYTTVLADSGKQIFHPAADTNARTFTIDSNANVAYAIGTVLTFINQTANVVTIAITSDTLTLAGTTSTGSRSLAQNGVATAIKVATTSWVISGSGLT